jgi:hypothetical protein
MSVSLVGAQLHCARIRMAPRCATPARICVRVAVWLPRVYMVGDHRRHGAGLCVHGRRPSQAGSLRPSRNPSLKSSVDDAELG